MSGNGQFINKLWSLIFALCINVINTGDHCTLHTAHCILKTAHCTLKTAHCTLHIENCVINWTYWVIPTALCNTLLITGWSSLILCGEINDHPMSSCGIRHHVQSGIMHNCTSNTLHLTLCNLAVYTIQACWDHYMTIVCVSKITFENQYLSVWGFVYLSWWGWWNYWFYEQLLFQGCRKGLGKTLVYLYFEYL